MFEDLLRTKIEGAIASGTYDVGVETLTAESLVVTDRRALYVHPETGAETQIFTIRRRERNRPLTLAEALDRADDDPRAMLLVNTQSGRAAVQVPAPSLMLDDGEVERRVRLLRPMERTAIPLTMMAQTHWEEADRASFSRAWEKELADDSDLHGQPSAHRHRAVAADLEAAAGGLDAGLSPPERCRRTHHRTAWSRRPGWRRPSAPMASPLAPADAWTAVLDGRTVLELQDGLQLRRAKVMGAFRVELTGFTDGMVERLKAMGLVSEIIAWKLRLFVPTGANGPAILGALMERYPLVRIADRAAA